jgi:hypothetical protein
VYSEVRDGMISVQTPYFQGNGTTLPSAWIAALLNEEPVNVVDVVNGVVPVPPSAEVVTAETQLLYLEDLKKITRTLMRMTNPYDHISFLPADS